jgi:hypothetical protein
MNKIYNATLLQANEIKLQLTWNRRHLVWGRLCHQFHTEHHEDKMICGICYNMPGDKTYWAITINRSVKVAM